MTKPLGPRLLQRRSVHLLLRLSPLRSSTFFASARQRVALGVGDPLEADRAVDAKLPCDSKSLSELISNLSLVDGVGSAEVGTERSLIKRSEASILAAGQVRDHDVGVQVRIPRTRCSMGEASGDGPFGTDRCALRPA